MVLINDIAMFRKQAGIARVICGTIKYRFYKHIIHSPFYTYTQPYNVCETVCVSFAFQYICLPVGA